MEVKIKVNGVKEALKKFDKKVIEKATVRSLNRAAASGKTTASRKIRDNYEIKTADVNKYLKVEKASVKGNKFSAALTAISAYLKSRIPLVEFKVKQAGTKILRQKGRSVSLTKKARKKISPVQIKVKKAGGWKALPAAFIVRMKSGHIGVFERIPPGKRTQDRKSSAIRELTSVDIPLMMSQKNVMDETKKKIKDQFVKDFKHELEYEMGKK